MSKKPDILTRLDSALLQMRERGHHNTIHYARLLAKRQAIAHSAEYQVIDVTEAAIRGVASHIPAINRNTKGKRIPTHPALPYVIEPSLWREDAIA